MSLEDDFRHMWFDHKLFDVVRAAVAAEDREWFEAHPSDNYRLRPYVPGEGDSADGFFITPPEHLMVRAERDGSRTYLTLDPIGPEVEVGPPAAYRFEWDEDEDADAA